MREERQPRVVEREGRVAVVRDVPVLVCDECGEVYLDTNVAKQLDTEFMASDPDVTFVVDDEPVSPPAEGDDE
jgi:YgiT-type zinc finger domain-containing protein